MLRWVSRQQTASQHPVKLHANELPPTANTVGGDVDQALSARLESVSGLGVGCRRHRAWAYENSGRVQDHAPVA